MTATVNEKLLEERLVALEGVRTWGPRVVSRLEAVIRSGNDEALFRINPITFAADKSLPRRRQSTYSCMPRRSD